MLVVYVDKHIVYNILYRFQETNRTKTGQNSAELQIGDS